MGKSILLTGPLLFRLFCSIKGLEIVVEKPFEQVFISIR